MFLKRIREILAVMLYNIIVSDNVSLCLLDKTFRRN